MTEEDFEKFFHAVYASLPAEMHRCLQRFHEECMHTEICVDDQAVFKAQRKYNVDFFPACLVDFNDKWFFLFRSFLLAAPSEILKTIVRHEILHAFIFSVEGMPTAEAQKIHDRFLKRLEASYEESGRTPGSDYERIEDLIKLMNNDLGGDEGAAQDWVNANRPPEPTSKRRR